jgi:hypothetical protein
VCRFFKKMTILSGEKCLVWVLRLQHMGSGVSPMETFFICLCHRGPTKYAEAFVLIEHFKLCLIFTVKARTGPHPFGNPALLI